MMSLRKTIRCRLLPCKLFLLVFLLAEAVTQDRDGVCSDIDVRNKPEYLQVLENCTVIEGQLHILLIDSGSNVDYEKYSFPKLVEITDHLMLYRVYGLQTLRNLFPNLKVIRGQKLFHNFALIAHEMPDLETLGLVGLTTIMRGAVRLMKNPKLCYIDTIDWSKIATSVDTKEHYFKQNKDEQECVNICPESCIGTEVQGVYAKRCWTSDDHDCQKNLQCPDICTTREGPGYCVGDSSKCCDHYCVGGCTGPTRNNCSACRNVTYENKCEPRCPPSTFMFMNRRCLLHHECINMKGKSDQDHWKILLFDPREAGQCVEVCPKGYSVSKENPQKCEKCVGFCPKECVGKTVDSIESAQGLKGCTKINGPLEIKIMGGNNIGQVLEDSLGMIQEVTDYIKIVRSYPLLSLGFFKNLRVIRGVNLEVGYYSLIVKDNSNLQELFPEEMLANLSIKNGNVFFHFNRKLCYSKIKDLLNRIHVNFTSHDVSEFTNGDQIPCSVTNMSLLVNLIGHDYVILQWEKYRQADVRQLLSYVLNYRVAESKNVNIYQGRDACLDTIWTTRNVDPHEKGDQTSQVDILIGLEPWTQYVVYIQTYTLSTANGGANSELLFFKTLPHTPSRPVNVEVFVEEPGELRVKWEHPLKPSGPVTHYIVYWQLQELETEAFDKRDYCDNPIVMPDKKKEKPEEEENKYTNHTVVKNGNCCACPKSKENLEKLQRQRQLEIEFENDLHDKIYTKRPERKRPKRSAYSEPEKKPNNDFITYDVTSNKEEKNSSLDDENPDNTTKNVFHQATVYGTEITIPDLGHFQEYNIEVLACHEKDVKTGYRYCSSRTLSTARTQPSLTADNINASTVKVMESKNGSKEVLVKWASPEYPNGVIITFQIEYKKLSTADVEPTRICFTHKKYRQLGGYLFRRLQAGNYSFRIRATSLAGNGSFTVYKHFVVPPDPASKNMGEAVIAAVVIGIILVIIITIIVVWFVAKSRYAKDQDVTTISMNPGYIPSADVYLADDWEVDRDTVKLIGELGQGSFGMVYKGIAKEINNCKMESQVAVKTVNDSAGWHDRMMFLKEASIMKSFSCHHVVKLLGVVSKGQPALVIMELMLQGDLRKFLRLHRPDEEENHGQSPPTLKQILQMSGEIADGMAYLADKKFVHRDLAARNCMVADVGTVKIGDFGMARDIYETDYYRKGGKGLLPVRWMAPESLKDGIFTTMSDVWSYGVVLWEMATLAAQPYQGLSNEEVLKYVIDGRTMERPDGCPDKIYDLMLQCWRYRYKKRPTFKEIIEMLVPDLDPTFKNLSYFFSDENKPDVEYKPVDRGEEVEEDVGDGDIDGELKDIEYEEQSDEDMDVTDESRIPFMSVVQSPNLNSVEMQRSPSRRPPRDPLNTSPCECVLLEEMPNGHRNSTCSSPNSGVGYSDGSKGSSKSSNSSYTQVNGLANGHIHMRVPRTTPC